VLDATGTGLRAMAHLSGRCGVGKSCTSCGETAMKRHMTP